MNRVKHLWVFILLVNLFSALAYAEQKTGVVHLTQQQAIEKIQQDKKNTVLIDVRTVREYNAGHLPNAINIPHKDILNNLSLLDQYKGKDVILYCHSGVRVKRVTDAADTGKVLYHLKGDYRAWRAQGLPIEKP